MDNTHTDDTLALRRFRTGLLGCFGRWSDTLFELCDAVLCTPGRVVSVPMLSLEGEFRRSHGSLYKALDDGHISFDALKGLLIANLPDVERRVFAVDASTWARCDAETSPERGFYYSASTHSAGQPIVAGWSYQWISQLDFDPNSWCAPADIYRIPPTANSTQATIDQVRQLVESLDEPDKPPALLVFDAGYDPIAISHELADCPVEILVRIRDDRVFHGRPPNKPDRPANTGGRPPRHGPRHKCSNPATWAPPEQTHTTSDLRYGNITIGAWSQLHPRLNSRGHWTNHETLPIVEGTIIRVEVELLPKPTSRTKKTLWLWWSGPGRPDLDLCARAYLHRFDIEHSFRFAKNTLGWVTPSICTPEQADRWTWTIAAAYTQLRLARHLIADHKLPWERPRKPHQLSPARIRRGFRALTATIGTPANPPKPSRAGPGRPKGSRSGPRPHHPAIKKTA
jgi:hypothetical protein